MVFRKRLIDDVRYEAASVFDVNGDGVLDIVCGEHWYEGPAFETRHCIGTIRREGEYYDDFSNYPLDVNGDGRLDIITGGWWGKTVYWRENPGDGGEWPVHEVDRCGNVETIRFFDIDGCGTVEVVPNTPYAPQVFYKLLTDERERPIGEFEKYTIYEGESGHGLGFGDVDGDGRTDVILAEGWLKCPENPLADEWTFHREFDLGKASIPIIAHDVTGNGRYDLIAGRAHDYGLSWWEQTDGLDGGRQWVEHDIDSTASQYHDLQLADVDGDGTVELVTGTRYRAHSGDDPGADDPLGIYYFDIDRHGFEKHVIDHGPPATGAGCGIYFWIEDVTGNGWLDIVAPGKDGLHLFENLGRRVRPQNVQ